MRIIISCNPKHNSCKRAQSHLLCSSAVNPLMQLQSNTSAVWMSVTRHKSRFGVTVLCPVGAPPAVFLLNSSW